MKLAVPLDPNEGWNAYWSNAAIKGEALYPAASTYLVNNYPPLSFYAVGAVGRLLGDNILAGRLISLVAFAFTLGAVWVAARRMGCGNHGAIFAALLLSAYLLAFTDYVGMNDPQLIGNALGTWGMVILLREPRREGSIFWTAVLLSLAFFVKHNLIVQPLVLVLWLALYDLRSALRLAVWGGVFLLVGVIAFRLAYARDLLTELHSARAYSFANLSAAVSQWLPWRLLAFVATLMLVAFEHRNKYAVLCGIYAAISFLLGAVFMGGTGVDVNALFDADIALSLAAGLIVNHLSKNWITAWVVVAAVYVFPVALGLRQVEANEVFNISHWINPLNDERQVAFRDIAFLRGRPGPVLCETLALCYWAKKGPEVDVFNVGQQFATKEHPDDELVGLVTKQHYAAIQFNSLTDFPLTHRVRGALARAYDVDHEDDLGVFLLPRRHPG